MNRTFVIAEAGVNHNGSEELALQLVDVAARCGADAVKFQTFKADKLVRRGAAKAAYQEAATGGGDQHSMLAGLEMSEELHRRLFDRCAERGIEFMSTPFDEEAADFLVGLGMRRIKIPSGEITNHPFLRHLARKDRPLILSTGMATLEEIIDATDVIRAERQRRGLAAPLEAVLTILHCTSNYPAAVEDVNLRAMGTIASAVGVPVGYSDHTLGLAVSTAAVALGAVVIEKHFTLDSALPGPDHKASLTPDELAALVGQIPSRRACARIVREAPDRRRAPRARTGAAQCDLGPRFACRRTGIRGRSLPAAPWHRHPSARDRSRARPSAGARPAGRHHAAVERLLLSAHVPRRICYLTGTRADFGLMTSTLRAIAADPRLQLQLIVTGMHLSNRHGSTSSEVEAEGFDIAARVPVDLDQTSAAGMAMNLGHMLLGFVPALQAIRPDLLLLLGDRGEMLAGALAAIHLGIPVAHLHGGERSGTVDEPVRHAISKLAHLHLVATAEARDRLVRMGERGETVHVVGAPGVDGLVETPRADRATLCREVGFDPGQPVGLLVFHPVLQEADDAARQVREVISAAAGVQVLAMMPNSDAGSEAVRAELSAAAARGQVTLRTHLRRDEYIGWLAGCDVMIGNSSSGIIEAASFGTPVVNIGSRQNMRERNANVCDVPAQGAAVRAAITASLARGRFAPANVYGDGQAGRRIVERLATTPITSQLMAKCNAF